MVVFDTYAWIEYFRGSDKGLVVRDLLLNGGITPSIVLAEIARKYLREGVPMEDTRKRLLFIQGKTLVKHVDIDVSLLAGRVYLDLLEHSRKTALRTPSLADAIVYAMALIEEDRMVTGDRLFRDLPGIIYIGD